jgi:hypothetical protein
MRYQTHMTSNEHFPSVRVLGAGTMGAPIARAIASRWRGLVADGATDVDVAARSGLDDDERVRVGAGIAPKATGGS